MVIVIIKNESPLYRLRKRGQVGRSKDRVSYRRHKRAPSTHPDIAALVDPLFDFVVKRVVMLYMLQTYSHHDRCPTNEQIGKKNRKNWPRP